MRSIGDRLSPYNDALRVSSFRKLLVGQGLSMAGDAICLAALPIALIRAGFGAEVFGLVMAAVALGTVTGALAGGVLADRKSAKQVLIHTDTARGIAQLAAVALLVSGAVWWCLLVAYLIFGIGIGVSRPCAQVLLVNLLPRQALAAGNAAMNFVDNLVAVVFPATLGVFIILWDPVWGILIDGLTFFCAALYTAQLPDMAEHAPEDEFSIGQALKGITLISGNAMLLLGFAATLVVNVLCFPIFLVVAPYAISERFSESMWGLCLAASGLGACIGSIVTVLASGHERLPGLAVTCGLFLAGAMALLGLGSSAWMAIRGNLRRYRRSLMAHGVGDGHAKACPREGSGQGRGDRYLGYQWCAPVHLPRQRNPRRHPWLLPDPDAYRHCQRPWNAIHCPGLQPVHVQERSK